jgi:transposase
MSTINPIAMLRIFVRIDDRRSIRGLLFVSLAACATRCRLNHTLSCDSGHRITQPPRCNRNEPICFSSYLYRARNLVEWFFNKIKQCRRVATRYDKLAANYLAFIQLASIRLWLRVNEYTA